MTNRCQRSHFVFAAILASLLLGAAAAPQTPSAATPPASTSELTSTAAQRTAVNITVYNNGYGLVRERREVRLPRGEFTLRYEDVTARINPATVQLRSLSDPRGLSVREQDFEYDLLSPDTLLAKYVGKPVTLLGSRWENNTQIPTRTQAVLLSDNQGRRVFRLIGDRAGDQILVDFHNYNGISVNSLPSNLYSHPTLLWRLVNQDARPQTLEASYLTNGMSWSADYVLALDAAETRGDLTAWVTVKNESGAAFANARLQLVAGVVHVVRPAPVERNYAGPVMAVMASPAPPQFQQQPLFEYHLYTLQRPATLADQESKQIDLLTAPSVPLAKSYVLDDPADYLPYIETSSGGAAETKPKVAVEIGFRDDAASGVSQPLPAGTVRVYLNDAAGGQEFIGEDEIQHTPVGEKVQLKLGDAFDLTATRTRTDFQVKGRNQYEAAYRVTLRNAKDQAVTVRDNEALRGDWRLLDSSQPAAKPDAATARFELQVPARGEVTLTYRVEEKY